MQIYKIFLGSEWAELEENRETLGAPVDLADGYIHFSTAAQAPETAAKYFANRNNLMLLACETGTLGEALKWEPSRGGDLFPHLYRPLRLNEIIWAKPLPVDNGTHIFPADMR